MLVVPNAGCGTDCTVAMSAPAESNSAENESEPASSRARRRLQQQRLISLLLSASIPYITTITTRRIYSM